MLGLGGCSTTFPVVGSIPSTKEKFIGTATSQLAGISSLIMRSDNGATCTGEYKAPVVWTMTEGATASGTFHCDDGRSGTFTFVGTAIQGEGFGNMNDGTKMEFTYGRSVTVRVR